MKLLLKKYSYSFVFIFFFLFWFSILVGSGSLFSGYHAADDQEIFEIHNDLLSSNNDIVKVTKKWITNDISTRFKPLFYPYRVLKTWFFGTNFTLWLTYKGLLAVITSFCLFLFVHKIGFSLLESILFPLLSLLGAQAVVWWSSGINESLSMFLLSLSLVFMAFSIYSEKRRRIYEWFFIMFAILMSLSKENFILMMPALLFWKIWLYREKNAALWSDSIKKNMLPTVVLLLVMFMEFFIIVKWIGTKPFGNAGAGLDAFKPLSYLIMFKDATLSISTIGLGLILLTGGFLLIICDVKSIKDILPTIVDLLRGLLYPLILFALVTGPQFVIYSRCGFCTGRYILPIIMGYSGLLIYLLRFLRINSDLYFINLPNRSVKWVSLLGIIIGLFLVSVSIVFAYNQSMREFLFSTLGRPNYLEIGDISAIVKPVALSISLGVLIISCAWLITRKSDRKLAIKDIILCLSVMAVFYKMTLSFAGAYGYALEGKRFAMLFQAVKKNTKPDDIILIVVDPVVHNEAGYLTKRYINNVAQRGRTYVNVMFVNSDTDEYTGSYIGLFESKTLSTIEDKRDVNFVIIFQGLELKFINDSKDWFHSSHFKREANNVFVIYYRSA